MPDKPAVSVVLPTYNRASTLRHAIDSVVCQDFGDFELIVVDDGSRDETALILADVNDPRLRVVRLPSNRGQAYARNVGLDAASADLAAFQDSDDIWHPNKLSRQIAAIRAAPDVSVVYSDMRRIRFDGSSYILRAPRALAGDIFDARPSLYSARSLGIQSCLIRKAAVCAVGGFDERRRVWDDLELFLRMIDQGYRFQHLPKVLVDYYETMGVSHDVPERRKARLALLRTYGHRLACRSPLRLAVELVQALRT